MNDGMRISNQPKADIPLRIIRQEGPPIPPIRPQSTPDHTDYVQPAQQNRAPESAQAAQQQDATVKVDEQQLIDALQQAVKSMQGPYTYLEFSIHEATKQLSVSVRDKETGEVLRQIPSEKSLDFLAKLWEMTGLLVDRKL
jgi:flagellar protein FlaG